MTLAIHPQRVPSTISSETHFCSEKKGKERELLFYKGEQNMEQSSAGLQLSLVVFPSSVAVPPGSLSQGLVQPPTHLLSWSL